MQRYIIRRFIFSLFAIWATMTVTFIFMRLLPGDPVTTLVGEEGDPSQIEAIKARLGLDQPVPIQYFFYLKEPGYARPWRKHLQASACERPHGAGASQDHFSIHRLLYRWSGHRPACRNHLRHKTLFDLGSRCDSNRVHWACHARFLARHHSHHRIRSTTESASGFRIYPTIGRTVGLAGAA